MTKTDMLDISHHLNERLTKCVEKILETIYDDQVEVITEDEAIKSICKVYHEYLYGYEKGREDSVITNKFKEKQELKKKFIVIKND